jgi:hypothetical protein
MYREEADQLVALFRNSCTSTVISDEKNRFDDLDDMKNNMGARIHSLNIRGENPGVRFLFNHVEVVSGSNPPTRTVFNELRTEEITDAADALFYKMKDFLITHQQPQFRRGFTVGAIISFVGLVWVVLRYSTVDKQGQETLTLHGLVGMFILVLALVFFVVAGFNESNYLNLDTKRNSASFFVRNREEFAKHAVTAGISSVVAGIIGYCIGHFLR